MLIDPHIHTKGISPCSRVPADELVDMGMVDGIIGKDIELGEIFAFMSDAPCDCDDDEECDCKNKK